MSIISTQMSSSIKNGSWIRRMFEAGIQLKQKYGDDAVCDFSLGNPDLAPPPAVGKALAEFVKHVDEPFSLGYMPNNGFGWAREKLAAHLSKEQGVELTANDVILTCGAAGALNVIFRTVLEPGDEVLTVTPYFVEYGSYVGNHGGTLKKVPTLPGTFGLDLPAVEAAITPKTRAMIDQLAPQPHRDRLFPRRARRPDRHPRQGLRTQWPPALSRGRRTVPFSGLRRRGSAEPAAHVPLRRSGKLLLQEPVPRR